VVSLLSLAVIQPSCHSLRHIIVLADFLWFGFPRLTRLKERDLIVIRMEYELGQRTVGPPARVINIRMFREKKEDKAIVHYECRSDHRPKGFGQIGKHNPQVAEMIRDLERPKLITDRVMVHDILQLWGGPG
jgi:hypothetical protein